MSLTLELPLEVENELRAAAARAGQDVSQYLLEIALAKVRQDEAEKASARREWGEIVAQNQKDGLYD